MARARNIKPAFFDNDLLAEIEPLGRLLFIGLWTIADHKGDLIYREKRIKAQILPYDNCDIKKIMINLDKSGFIRFYSDGESIYLNIMNFSKHQNPHKNEREKGSDIPAYSESMARAVDISTLVINRDKNGTNPDNNEINRADSLLLIPDSLSPITDSPQKNAVVAKAPVKKFTPPSVEEVFKYCSERCNQVDAQNFVDHYSANGWVRGKTKIKDWKACVRTWEKNSKQGELKPKQYSDVTAQNLKNLEGGW